MNENIQIKAAVITISDSRRMGTDVSGITLENLLIDSAAEVAEKTIVSDDLDEIIKVLKNYAERDDINLILTTGGTGFSPRDNTPEATRAVIEKEAQGIAEAMRYKTLQKTPAAMLSRGVCGIYKNCLIINLPGSPKAVAECFEVIKSVLNHAVNLIGGQTKHND